ncbi:hypothetical protein PybrP1_008149 [[Pythium] brassicae (nom. inval.)]|nr:hypothetical protein PybrP1_008149 [[Pythium] brassicae (nom. inval.)]
MSTILPRAWFDQVLLSTAQTTPAAVSPTFKFFARTSFDQQMRAKTQSGETIENDGPLAVDLPGEWALLTDKGYEGLA